MHAKLDGNGFAQYEVDNYVAVQLEGCKKGKLVFIGQILEIDSNANEFKVAFLEKASYRNESLYMWPDKRDLLGTYHQYQKETWSANCQQKKYKQKSFVLVWWRLIQFNESKQNMTT